MKLDKRVGDYLVIGSGKSVPTTNVKVGDKATLYHKGRQIVVTITKVTGDKYSGTIVRSAYDHIGPRELEAGSAITFDQIEIHGIERE